MLSRNYMRHDVTIPFTISKRFASNNRGKMEVFDRFMKRQQRDTAASRPNSSQFDYLRNEVTFFSNTDIFFGLVYTSHETINTL